MSANNASNLASFAPYTVPPDDPAYARPVSNSPSRPSAASRVWFSAASKARPEASYQSGGIPTFENSQAGGSGASEELESQQNQWETSYGFRVDVLAAVAYIFGPLSAFIILILETKNDYVRFHAYQSALLTGPLLLLRLFFSILMFPSWMRSMLTWVIIVLQFYMAIRAYVDATRNGLARYQLPYIGPLADQYVTEE